MTILLLLVMGGGQNEPAPRPAAEDRAEAKEARAIAQKLSGEYDVELAGSTETALRLNPEPVLRWTNQLQRRFYGDVYVWTNAGRPEVVASITSVFGKQQAIETEIHSLSTERPRLSRGESVLWQPSRPGIELKPISNAPPPGASAAARLQQMRTMATEFSVFADYQNDRWQLRLLRAPIYRYRSTNSQVLDGALFAFVKGTDPDALLMIELHQDDDDRNWRFAFARLSGNCTLRAVHHDGEIWRVDQLAAEAIQDPQQPYFALRSEVPTTGNPY